MEKIVLVGFGGHAKSVADSIISAGQYEIAGYTDMEQSKEQYRNIPWLGTDESLADLYKQGVTNACVTVGYMGGKTVRDKLYYELKRIGYSLPTICDPTAIISSDARIEEGCYIGKGAIVGADSHIEKMCIINSGALIEHENVVGEQSHIAVRAVLCGNVKIEAHCFIGANATLKQGVCIAHGSVVGAGAVVLNSISAGSVVVGIPARIIKETDVE